MLINNNTVKDKDFSKNERTVLYRTLEMKIREHPYYWIPYYCYTLDSHDKPNPIKLMPDKDYLKILSDLWLKNPLMLIPKSRQMMITWLMTCLYLWDARWFTGRDIFFLSKKEEEANAILDRAKFTYNQLPPWQKFHRLQVQDPYCHLKFLPIHSSITALATTKDCLREHTASGVLCDEMAFQVLAEEMFAGAKPTIEGGGRFSGISTPNGQDFFFKCVYDLDEYDLDAAEEQVEDNGATLMYAAP